MWLRYTIAGSPQAMKFLGLKDIPERDVELELVRSLRHIQHSHTLSSRVLFQVQIGAGELFGSTAWDFLRAFWEADRRWYSSAPGTEPSVADEATTGTRGAYTTELIEVTIEGGTMPVEYLEGNSQARSFTATLTPKYPNARG